MRPLSATEAISPAIQRTKLVLFSPFRMGRTWKLCATSYLAICGQTFLPFTLAYLAFLPLVSRRFGATGAALLCAVVLASTALYCWIFYLCSRIKFAWFDMVANRGEFVAPAWRKYGLQSRRWTSFKFLLGCILCILVSVPCVAYVRHLIPILLALNAHSNAQPPMQLIASIFLGYGLLCLFFGVVALISGVLGDFIVPSLALEGTSIGDAFRRMLQLMRDEPGEFTLYIVLKTVLGGAGYMGAMIVSEVVIFIVMFAVEIVMVIGGLLLHFAGISNQILVVLGITIGVGVELLLIGYAMMLCIGPVFTFLDAYALYFLGGRYPPLGDLLDRSAGPTLYSYPAAYPHSPFPPPEPTPPPAPLAG